MADTLNPSAAGLGLLEQLGAISLHRAGAPLGVPAQRSPGSSLRARTEHALLPAGIADDRSRALMRLLSSLSALDLAPVLVYHIDTVPASALYALAWQFDVVGAAGWDLADTEVKQRDLLRNAIELHRHAGTPWVVKRVLGALGFATVVIDEGYGRPTYDGTFRYGGVIDYSSAAAWAYFRVVVGEIPDDRAVDDAYVASVSAVINVWKNARSQLAELGFTLPAIGDPLPVVREQPMPLELTEYFDYDAMHAYDGTIPYGSRDTAVGVV